MKKICKSLLLVMLALAMVLNTCGIVLADTTATISINEQTVTDDVKKLVFKATTPQGAAGMYQMNVVFSYDESVIELVDSLDHTLTAESFDYAFNALKFDARNNWSLAFQQATVGNRKAFAVSASAPSGKVMDASAGVATFEFYYKAKDGKEVNSETFKIESDVKDGSLLSTIYPVSSQRIAAFVSTATISGGVSTPADRYEYRNSDSDTMVFGGWDYAGSDKKVFKEITFEIEGNSTTIAAPTKYPAEAAKRIKITATAWATDGSEMEGYLDNFGWSTLTDGDDIALDEYARVDLVENNQALPKNQAVLVIKPGCPAGTVTVKGTNGSCEKEQAFTITREVEKAGAAVIKAKAGETEIAPEGTITVVKPATTGSKSVVFTGKVYGGYGDEISADVTFTVSEYDLVEGITFENNTLTVTNEAPDCNILAEATYGELELLFAIDVVGLEVDWTPVENAFADTIEYGMTNAEINTVTGTKGTASVDCATVKGEFAVLNPEAVLDAGETEIVVAFTADDTVENGEYAGIVINTEFPITIAKAPVVINAESIETTYTGQKVDVVATTNRGTDDTDIIYEVRKDSVAAEAIDAGEYTVYIYVPETANYSKQEKQVTITIAKAPVVITAAEIQTAVYDGTAKAVTANADNDVSRLEYSYLKEGAAAPVAEPVDAGTYTVTITAPELPNYEAAEAKVVTFTISPAEVTKYVEAEDDATEKDFDVTMTALEASTNGITSVEALADWTLYGYVWAAFEGGVVDVDGITWTTEDEWNPKEGTYTFTAAFPENDNLIFKPLEATVTVSKVVGTITSEPAMANKTVAKGRIEELDEFATFADLDIPMNIEITYPTPGGDPETATVELDIVWNKTVADLKAAAANVTADNNEEVELAIADSTYKPADGADFSWITIETGDKMTLIITDKTPATVTLTQEGKEYDGEVVADPVTTWTPSDELGDENATIQVTYVGVGDTVYEASTEKPVNAGTYEAVAKLNSTIYSGISEAVAFTIAPKAITATIADATKDYSDELPTFALESVEGLVGEDDLGVTFSCAADEASNVGTYAIEGKAANKNYDVDWTNGTLTIEPKDLAETDFVPVISGSGANGSDLTFAVAGLAADQYVWQWIDASTEAAYTLAWADSNRTITVTITGQGNYEGTKTSAGFNVPKYEISGALDFVNDNSGENDDALDAGDVISVDTTGIVDIAVLEGLGIAFEYSWTIDDVEKATTASYTVPAATVGDLAVTITATGDFAGSLTKVIGEIGKAPLKGTITLTESEGVITADATAVVGEFDLVWFVGENQVTATEGAYTVTPADYGKTLTVKAVAKGELYSGEVVATYSIPAIAPEATVSAVGTATTVIATVSAVENGAPVTSYTITITDGGEPAYTETYTGSENTYTFEGLTTGTTYTITATATNSAGTSAAATTTAIAASASRPRPSTPSSTPSTPSTTPTTPDAGSEGTGSEGTTTPEADVTVKVEDTTASMDKEIIAEKEAVEVATKTESGVAVTTTVNVAGAKVESLEVATKDSDKAAAGAAAEGAVGTPVEVKVEAKDAEGNKVDVTVNVAIPSEEKAYAYIIDENGVATRTESVYNEETGEVEVANVPDGAVVMLSTTAPATFDDAASHWAEGTINYAVDAGIMNGVGGSAFDPDGQATRGMVNAMMVRLAKVAGVELAETADQKVDTDAEHWAAATDLIALANGWTTGVRTLEDGTVVMDTEATVTREQLVTMLWRFLGNPEAEGEIATFEDHAETSEWAKDAKAWAVGAGIINGKPGNKLDPNGTATRAEIATMFGRLMNYMTK